MGVVQPDTPPITGIDYSAAMKAEGLAGEKLYKAAIAQAGLALKLKLAKSARAEVVEALRLLRAATEEQIQYREIYKVEAERFADVMDTGPFLTSHKIRLADIARAVCKRAGVRLSDVRSKSRVRHIVLPRHEIMYFACALTNLSLPAIGAYLHRTHWTVMAGRDAHEKRMKEAGV